MPASASTVFAWHERPSALFDLLPFRSLVRVLHQSGGVRDEGRVVFAMGVGPLRLVWEAVHFGYVEGQQFRDRQVRGPFRSWQHTHRVEPLTDTSSVLEDRVEYELPGGRVASAVAGWAVRRMLVSMFERRHAITRKAMRDG